MQTFIFPGVGRLRVVSLLGEGTYSTVHEVDSVDGSGGNFALKLTSAKNRSFASVTRNEIRAYQYIESQFSVAGRNSVAERRASGETPDYIFLLLVRYQCSLLDALNGKPQHRRYFSLWWIRHILGQLLPALLDMVRNRVVHADLKLENIVFDKKNNVRLLDFGTALLPDDPPPK
jgi:serine/threonine protein kinase